MITDANRPQVGDDLQIIFRIPWGHNKIILDKCKGNSAKALLCCCRNKDRKTKLIPEEFRGSMPTIEEIEAELNE